MPMVQTQGQVQAPENWETSDDSPGLRPKGQERGSQMSKAGEDDVPPQAESELALPAHVCSIRYLSGLGMPTTYNDESYRPYSVCWFKF